MSIPTICLNMIVKNESKIITRLFDSVLPIIDCYCICDTGSTDDTIDIINKYFSNKNIPGKVVHEPFKNFCYNRNFALQTSIGMSDYVLLLDADMILDIKNFDKKILDNYDSFTILQGNDSFFYQNLRIIKNNGLYTYVGVTHEYIDSPNGNRNYDITKDTLFIKDIGDGGCKTNKYERDVKLLTEGIQEDPSNVRYYFYLANSFHDLGRNEEAIETYEKRISMGGWNQEVWYSHYRIGNCYKNLGKISDAIYHWLNSFDYLSERLEGIYEIIKHYRIISKHKLAHQFYLMAKKILDLNLDTSNYLFVHNDIYTNKIYYEYTIIAAYLGIQNINDEIVLILNKSNDFYESQNLLSNMKFYKYVLTQKDRIILDNSITKKINGEYIKFTSSSSCLIPISKKCSDGNSTDGSETDESSTDDSCYLMNMRYVNYNINTDNGAYLNCDKFILTMNKYIKFNKNFDIVEENMFKLNFDNRLYMGVEDVRIFKNNNEMVHCIGTGYHKDDTIGIVEGVYNMERKELQIKEIKPSFCNSNCEKNWVYVNYNNETSIIYKWYPLQICNLNKQTNLIDLKETKEMPKIFSNIRGSTCGFQYENEIWFVCHLVSYETPRHYYHVIVVFDAQNMNLLRYSAPFKFEGESIEYCLSIVVEDHQVLMNYSTWDRTTRIGVYEKNYIDSILVYQ
jgi:tetratricopeptide (TPR) repeat protein